MNSLPTINHSAIHFDQTFKAYCTSDGKTFQSLCNLISLESFLVAQQNYFAAEHLSPLSHLDNKVKKSSFFSNGSKEKVTDQIYRIAYRLFEAEYGQVIHFLNGWKGKTNAKKQAEQVPTVVNSFQSSSSLSPSASYPTGVTSHKRAKHQAFEKFEGSTLPPHHKIRDLFKASIDFEDMLWSEIPLLLDMQETAHLASTCKSLTQILNKNPVYGISKGVNLLRLHPVDHPHHREVMKHISSIFQNLSLPSLNQHRDDLRIKEEIRIQSKVRNFAMNYDYDTTKQIIVSFLTASKTMDPKTTKILCRYVLEKGFKLRAFRDLVEYYQLASEIFDHPAFDYLKLCLLVERRDHYQTDDEFMQGEKVDASTASQVKAIQKIMGPIELNRDFDEGESTYVLALINNPDELSIYRTTILPFFADSTFRSALSFMGLSQKAPGLKIYDHRMTDDRLFRLLLGPDFITDPDDFYNHSTNYFGFEIQDYIGPSFLNNKGVILKLIAECSMHIDMNLFFKKLNPYLINDKEVVLEFVQYTGNSLDMVPDQFKDDFQIVIAAVQGNGLELEFASDRLKANDDVVSEAIKNEPLAFQFADSKYRKHKYMILLALKYSFFSSNNPQSGRLGMEKKSIEFLMNLIDPCLKSDSEIQKAVKMLVSLHNLFENRGFYARFTHRQEVTVHHFCKFALSQFTLVNEQADRYEPIE